jgi:cobalt/nickel transport system ATP-binding protein
MMHCIETLLKTPCCHNGHGKITVCNVDRDNKDLLSGWLSSGGQISVGAMGTRAKQYAENSRIRLDFTYGVIDKCILKALLGEDSLILTTENMVKRVYQRVDAYGKECGIIIPVQSIDPAPKKADEMTGDLS